MGQKGLIIVYTGGGKGKTSAALGLVLRAVGYNHKVCMVQFVKGSWHYGEVDSAKRLAPEFELITEARDLLVYLTTKVPARTISRRQTRRWLLARRKLCPGNMML